MRTTNPPVLILGGQENTLSLCRSFGKRGIAVFISVPHFSPAAASRYCSKVFFTAHGWTHEDYWHRLLLQEEHPELMGAVIFPGSDDAVEFMCRNKRALQANYLVDDYRPELHMAMLDKSRTLSLAKKAGCPVPAYHKVCNMKQLETLCGEIVFPIMIKPLHSHHFARHFPDRKYFTAKNMSELRETVRKVLDKGIALIITEIIPGPDDLQSAYFTYINKEGKSLLHYTHQIVRRYPRNSGLACFTVTRQLPQTLEMGRRFFEGIGYRGMGHIEFKHDPRDGILKVIECNPRLSAAQEVVTKSGLDVSHIVYDYLVNGNDECRHDYREGVRRWWVMRDLLSFFELRKSGEITFWRWITSIGGHPLAFPYFSFSDPKPFFYRLHLDFSHYFKKRLVPGWMLKKESLQRR